MDVGHAVDGDGIEVVPGAVTFVLVEVIVRIHAVQAAHEPVSRDLGDDRGRGNAEALGVAPDDRQHPARPLEQLASVHQHQVGFEAKRLDRAVHGHECGLENVVTVDGGRMAERNADGDCARDDLQEERFTLFLFDRLGIVDAKQVGIFTEHHRRRNHGTGERAASRFIDPGDDEKALGLELAIERAQLLETTTNGGVGSLFSRCRFRASRHHAVRAQGVWTTRPSCPRAFPASPEFGRLCQRVSSSSRVWHDAHDPGAALRSW